MKRTKIITNKIISGLIMIIVFTSCAVVKTPYFKTDYYKKTVSRLDSLKSGISFDEDSVYAGFSRINITPGLNNKIENPEEGIFNKVPLAGFGNRKGKPATGVHDSIFVKAVALQEGQKTLVLISADLLLMPPNIIDAVTLSLAKEGLERNQLFFSATHSHSSIGGWGYGALAKIFSGKENINIEKWLISQIEKAVLEAVSDLHPAALGSGSFNASRYTRNRLTGDPTRIIDDFNFLIIEQTGKKKAIIGSFSAHATTIGRKNMEISADYPGYWERKMEGTVADMAMFCGGSMGSQSPVGGKEDEFENAKFIGESLADSLTSHMNIISMSPKPVISSLSLKIFLPEYHIRLTTNRNLTSGLSNRLMELPKNVYLQALSINNLMWIFTPGDFSGESALQLKNLLAAKGYDAFVTGYNGSYIGYIIPGKYFYLDNYESKMMGWFGPTMGDYAMDLIEQMSNAIISLNPPE
jgi:neutral ceramidase